MARNQKIYTPKDRARILKEWKRSDVGVMQFCKQQGIAYDTLRGWIKKNEEGQPLESSSRRGPNDPQARIQAVEAFEKSGLTVRDFAKTWGVGPSSLARWAKIYREQGPKGLQRPSLVEGAKKRGPKGIPRALKEEIADVKRKNPNFGLRQVRGFLNRFRGVDANEGTINRTIKEENLVVPPVRRRRRRSANKVRRFEMERPMQLWQTDITSFSLTKHQIKCYLTVFLDDRSRFIVGWNVGLKQSREFVVEALLSGIQRFGRPETVLSDQGPQYFSWKGKSKFQKLLKQHGIHHSVARSHHPQTVGKCERFWKTMKDELWERTAPTDLDDARTRMAHFINHYNHFRPNQGIDNMVPADRFFGIESDIRKAIERSMSDNEVLLATGNRPRAPVFLVGQINGKAISMHGEDGKIVLHTPGDEPREIKCESVEHIIGGSDEGQRSGSGEEGTQRAPCGSQANAEAAPEVCVAGENAVGAGERGAEGESAHGGNRDPGALDGADHESGGGQAFGNPDVTNLAAVTAGDLGYAGGAAGAAQDESERSAGESERRSQSVVEENRKAGADDTAARNADPSAAHDAGLPGRIDAHGSGGEE
jgi:transposase InsO family protein